MGGRVVRGGGGWGASVEGGWWWVMVGAHVRGGTVRVGDGPGECGRSATLRHHTGAWLLPKGPPVTAMSV